MAKQRNGFSLIEISIVVAIVSILLSLGLTALNAQLNSVSASVTKKRQEIIKDALIGYLGANKRFPCPYLPTPGTVVTGLDPTTTAPASGTPRCPPNIGTISFGVIPFATLGLSGEIAQDGWGNLFSYQVYSEPKPICPGLGKDWSNSLCFGEGKSGGLIVYADIATPPTLPPVLAQNIVAVILSHGPNGLGAWSLQGTRNVTPTTCSGEALNAQVVVAGCTFLLAYYKGERQDNDDVVAYLSAEDAIQPLVKQGTIKSALGRTADELQALYDQTLWAKFAQVSGTPPAPASGCNLPVPQPSQVLDPWGTPYLVTDSSPVSGFPICIYSKGGGPENCAQPTCTTTTTAVVPPALPNPPAICKSIDRATFNSYLNRASKSNC